MNNNYVSLNRALQNTNLDSPNSSVNRNNIINKKITSAFLKHPEQTRNPTELSTVQYSSQPQVQYVSQQVPVHYSSQPQLQYVSQQVPVQYSSQPHVQYVTQQVPIQYVTQQVPIQYVTQQVPVQYVTQPLNNLQKQNKAIEIIKNKKQIKEDEYDEANEEEYEDEVNDEADNDEENNIKNKVKTNNINVNNIINKAKKASQLINNKSVEVNKAQELINNKSVEVNKAQELINNKSVEVNKAQELINNKTSETPYYSVEYTELKNNLEEIKKKIDNIPASSNKTIYDVDCDKKINVVKNELLDKINKINDKNKNTKINYINDLFDLLISNEVLTNNEINNIRKKIESNEIDHDTIILYLENKKKLTKQLKFNPYRNINNYGDFLEGKWQVPMPKPPVCINNAEMNKVYQYDAGFNNYAQFK